MKKGKKKKKKLMIKKEIVKELLKDKNTPFYIFEENAFIQNYINLKNAFCNIYPNYEIAYSYKTNYTPYICKCVKNLGGYAEVVSDMELTLAKKIGYNNKKIIYNGPCKGKMLDDHLIAGGISNIDNYNEAKRITEIAKKFPNSLINVGVRINSDIGANYISRFGLELESDELNNTIKLLKKFSNIHIAGFHCHVSRARNLEAWKRRIDNLIRASELYLDYIPDYLDLGSGMYGDMDDTLSKQFGNNIPSYDDYANVVATRMKEHYKNSDKKPLLITEPGTTIVARYLSLITQAINKKKIKDKFFITVNSSYYNVGEICLMKEMPTYVISNNTIDNSDYNENVDIMGYTCLEQDCIIHNFKNKIELGDFLVIGNVGGYSIVSKPPFIQPNCPVYAYTKDNKFIEIKRQEDFEDIFNTFSFN